MLIAGQAQFVNFFSPESDARDGAGAGPASDPLGHALLGERLRACAGLLEGMFEEPLSPTGPVLARAMQPGARFYVTGTGASEGHARFLVYLLNTYTPARGEYLPLSAFRAGAEYAPGATLVVFSQGLSPNAQIALRRWGAFGHVVLITAVTTETAVQAGRPDRVRMLQQLEEGGHTLVRLPVPREERILLRVMGPLAGYLLAIQFVEAHWPGCVPLCVPGAVVAAVRNAPARVGVVPSESIRQGCHLVGAWPFPEFAQNLGYKFMEGLFLPAAPLWDYLSFAHGPFQQLLASPRPVLVLHGNSETEQMLLARVRPLIQRFAPFHWVIESRLPGFWRIFEYEMILNYFVLRAMGAWGVDQRRWPGQGLDGSLYHLDALPQ